MNPLTRMAVGAVAAVALVAPATAALADPTPRAAAKSWTTLETFERAHQQACKTPVADGTAWKIYNRLDARDLRHGRVAATLTAYRNGRSTSRDWTSGWVRHGDVSDVGSFRVPRGGLWSLSMSIHTDNAGTGGETSLRHVGRC